MIQKLVNRVAVFMQRNEEAKYPDSQILHMPRYIQLNNYSCGIVCAFVILRFYGKVNSISEIIYNKNSLKKDGIDTEPLLNILKSNDVKISVNEDASLEDIKIALSNNEPVLISIRDGDHWVVVYGYNKDRIFILDSSVRSSLKCSMLHEKFIELWDENWIAIVSDKN